MISCLRKIYFFTAFPHEEVSDALKAQGFSTFPCPLLFGCLDTKILIALSVLENLSLLENSKCTCLRETLRKQFSLLLRSKSSRNFYLAMEDCLLFEF